MKTNNKSRWIILIRLKIVILLYFVTILSVTAQDDSLHCVSLDLHDSAISFLDTMRLDSSEVYKFTEKYNDNKKVGPNEYFQIIDYKIYEDELLIISREKRSGNRQIIWRSFIWNDNLSYLSLQNKVVLGYSHYRVYGFDVTDLDKQRFIDYSKCKSYNVKKLFKTDFELVIINNSQFEVKSSKVVTASFGLEYKFCQKLVETTEIVSLKDVQYPFLPIDRFQHFEYYCDCQ